MIIKKVTITKLKNKISSFKGSNWLKSWPDKAFFQEITEQTMKDIAAANKKDKMQMIYENDNDESE